MVIGTWNSDANNLSTILNSCIYPFVFVSDGKSIPVTNTGHSNLSTPHCTLHLNTVLITPNIVKNLIFVRQFVRDNKCTIEFDEFGFFVKDLWTRQILLRCDSTGDLYPITILTPPQAFLVNQHKWRQLLGHPRSDVLHYLVSRNFISCNKTKSPVLCHACQLGKLPFLIICLHYLWVYPLRNKSDALSKFVHFRAFVKNQFNCDIKSLQCDHGGEFDNNALHQIFASNGITIRFSCPKTSQQNGKSERMVLVPRLPNANVVRSMWLFRHKHNADGSLSRYKAHLVANDSTQLPGIYVDETFSPVVKPATIHTVLSLALSQHWPVHQLEVKNAFLHGYLSETIYMHQPPGFWDPRHPDHVRTDTAYLLLYVDDIVLTASSSTFLRQNYATKVLEHAHMLTCNPCRTLVDTDSKLTADGDLVSDPTLYRSLVGALEYLTFTRPNISYDVQQVLRRSSKSSLQFMFSLVDNSKLNDVDLLLEAETKCFSSRRFTRREKDCFMSKGIKQISLGKYTFKVGFVYSASTILHSESASGHEASAAFTAEVDPVKTDPNDLGASYIEKEIEYAAKELNTSPDLSSSDDTKKEIKLEDLSKLVHTEEDQAEEVHTEVTKETEDASASHPPSLRFIQTQELTNLVLLFQSNNYKLEQQKLKAEAEVALLSSTILSKCQVSSVQAKIKTLDALTSLLSKVTEALDRTEKDAEKANLNQQPKPATTPETITTTPPIITSTTTQFQSPFLSSLPKSSPQLEGELIKKDKGKKAMYSKDAEEEGQVSSVQAKIKTLDALTSLLSKLFKQRTEKDAEKANLNQQPKPATTPETITTTPPIITSTTTQFQSPFLSSLPKSSPQLEGELIKKDKGKKAMYSKDAEEEGTESKSDDANLTGSRVKSSKQKNLKQFDFITEKGEHIHLITDQIKEQNKLEELAKADMAKQEVELGKEELVDLLGINVVKGFYKAKLEYDKYCDKMLNRRVQSKTTNCDVLTRKGPITLKVYREDGTNEIILDFKATDLHLSEWREVMQVCPNRKGAGWSTIYGQIKTRMDYLHKTKAELEIDFSKPLSEQDPIDKLNDLARKKRKHANDIHDYFRSTKKFKSLVQYEDHPAGTVLNEPCLGMIMFNSVKRQDFVTIEDFRDFSNEMLYIVQEIFFKLHQGPGLDDHARTFSSFLLAEVDKKNPNPLK
ncbi:ribonuclease H-like domain-containing protein [Tanacetum coccineum]